MKQINKIDDNTYEIVYTIVNRVYISDIDDEIQNCQSKINDLQSAIIDFTDEQIEGIVLANAAIGVPEETIRESVYRQREVNASYQMEIDGLQSNIDKLLSEKENLLNS